MSIQFKLIALALLILSFIGVYFYGRHDGAKLNEDTWQTREAQINAKAAALIADTDKKVIETEHAHAIQVSAIDNTYQKQIKDTNARLTIALNSLASTGGMYSHSSCSTNVANNMPNSSTSASSSDGTTRTKLPDQDAVFLLSEANRADKIVAQLISCQAIVASDRNK